jgi:hypothetical protein
MKDETGNALESSLPEGVFGLGARRGDPRAQQKTPGKPGVFMSVISYPPYKAYGPFFSSFL